MHLNLFRKTTDSFWVVFFKIMTIWQDSQTFSLALCWIRQFFIIWLCQNWFCLKDDQVHERLFAEDTRYTSHDQQTPTRRWWFAALRGSWSETTNQINILSCKKNGGAVANRLRRRTSDQTVLGSNPAVAAALSPWTRLSTPIVPRRSLHISFY